jgi:hypothetical protein
LAQRGKRAGKEVDCMALALLSRSLNPATRPRSPPAMGSLLRLHMDASAACTEDASQG